jgi:hypothetical protein
MEVPPYQLWLALSRSSALVLVLHDLSDAVAWVLGELQGATLSELLINLPNDPKCSDCVYIVLAAACSAGKPIAEVYRCSGEVAGPRCLFWCLQQLPLKQRATWTLDVEREWGLDSLT